VWGGGEAWRIGSASRCVTRDEGLSLGHLLFSHVGTIRMCEGVSMLPTFNYTGDWLLERKLSLSQLHTLKRGDLVTFRSPSSPMTFVCKRIIGLPGDVVNVDPIDLEISKQHCLVPEGHVWVQGDNATASVDSRTYGPLPMGLIQARIACRIWPLPKRIDTDLKFFG